MSVASEMRYDVFMSYRRADNQRGHVSALVARLEREVAGLAGTKLRVFFDMEEIRGGDDWEHRILRGLRESRLFLAALTPNYPKSEWCRREYDEFLRRAAVLHQPGEGVAAVYLLHLDKWKDDPECEAAATWLKRLHRHQRFDFHPWIEIGEAALQQQHVTRAFTDLCAFIVDRLHRVRRAETSPGNVPRLHAHFVGRIEELRQLRDAVALHRHGVVAGVLGLGGLGKTALALAYAHAYAWDYPGGRWFVECAGYYDSPSGLMLALRAFAAKLGIEFSEAATLDDDIARRELLRHFAGHGRTLMIFDNIESPTLLGPEAFLHFPHDDSLHIIATTRLGERDLTPSDPVRAFIPVGTLPDADGFALLQVHQPGGEFADSAEANAAREIVQILDGFTLALETAAIYLGTYAGEVTCTNFRDALRAAGLVASDAAAADARVRLAWHEKLVTHTLQGTWERLDAPSRFALYGAAHLPPAQIAVLWLRMLTLDHFPKLAVPTDVLSRDAWGNIVRNLLSLRIWQLAAVGENTVDRLPIVNLLPNIVHMHRLVHEAIRKFGAAEFPDEGIADELTLIAVDRGKVLWQDYVQEGARWEIEPLRATADLWLSQGSGAGAAVASAVCKPLNQIGRWREAEALLRKMIPLAEQNLPPDHPNLVNSYTQLGQAIMNRGGWREAEALFRRSIAIFERAGQTEDNSSASAFTSLAVLLHSMHRWREAEDACRHALAIECRCNGERSEGFLAGLQNLASILAHDGRAAEAEPLFQKAVTLAEEMHGRNHPAVARAYSNYANLLQDSGRLDAAETHFRRALAIDEECSGPEHHTVATRLNNLSDLLRVQQRYSEAEPLICRAIVIAGNTVGIGHPDYARTVANFGCLLLDTGRVGEAVENLRKALAISEESLGPEHPTTDLRRKNLAIALAQLQTSEPPHDCRH